MHRTSSNHFSLSWQDIALPLILVLTGLILVGGDWLGVLSLDRIADYWPCGVILVALANMTRPTAGERVNASETTSESVRHAR